MNTEKRGRRIELVCYQCGEVFEVPWKKRMQKYCGHLCKGRARFTPEYNAALARDEQAKAKRIAALRANGQGKSYTKINYRHTHRVVMEEILGRPLRKGEIVHHKDGNKLNNAPENLELLASQSEHCKEHGFGLNRRKPLSEIFNEN